MTEWSITSFASEVCPGNLFSRGILFYIYTGYYIISTFDVEISMKKAIAIGLPIVVLLGLGIYAQVVGWVDIAGFFNPPAVEEKVSGVVGDFRVMNFRDNSIIDHINIFTLVSSDGQVVNLGIDYDNLAFKDGDEIEVIFIRKLEKKSSGVAENKVDYKAQWYPVVSYRLLRKPVSAEK